MKTAYRLTVNATEHWVLAEPETPLLWILRENLGFTGTKYGCGIAQCGICMVLIDGFAVPACITPISSIGSKVVSTIEGAESKEFRALKQAWIEYQVPQCGFCQTGQLMAACALLHRIPEPGDDDIAGEMSRVLCRCGTYPRVKSAIHRAADILVKAKSRDDF